jgi:hypothetical protein
MIEKIEERYGSFRQYKKNFLERYILSKKVENNLLFLYE